MGNSMVKGLQFILALLVFPHLKGQEGWEEIAIPETTAIVTAFRQGAHKNNCASIALTKATIGTFGMNEVVKTKIKKDSLFVFELRNSEQITLTPKELDLCIMQNGFSVTKADPFAEKIKRLAATCFAVMCKKQQLIDDSSLDDAITRLNSGYVTSDIAPLLGLKFKAVKTTNFKKLTAFKNLVIYNYYHSAYASYGL